MQYRLHEISVGNGVLNVRPIGPDPQLALKWAVIGQQPEAGTSDRSRPPRTQAPGSPIKTDGPSA